MRYPAEAPISKSTRFIDRYNLQRFSPKAIPLGSWAVIGLVTVTSIASYYMFIYPKIHEKYYQEMQKQNRVGDMKDREKMAHGLRPWSDPFGRKKPSEQSE